MTRDEASNYVITLPGIISSVNEKLTKSKSQLSDYQTFSSSLGTLKGKIDTVNTFLSSAESNLSGGGYTDDFKTEDNKGISDAIDELDTALETLNGMIDYVNNDRIRHYEKEVEKYESSYTMYYNMLDEAEKIMADPSRQ